LVRAAVGRAADIVSAIGVIEDVLLSLRRPKRARQS